MFLIFGLSTKAELLGLVSFVCQVCGNAGPHQLVREKTRFSLFFVPLIPIRTRNAVHCPVCGARTPGARRRAAPGARDRRCPALIVNKRRPGTP